MSITDPYTDLFPALRQLLELVNRSSSIAPLPPPPHPPSVSEAAAREDFATIVRRVTTAELVSIRDKLRRGEVDGGIATACFFGHLARLRGSYYGGLQMDEDPYRPFERWLRRIGFGQTPTRGGAAATFENWLTEAIAAREGREEADEPVPEPLRRASGFYGFRVFSCDCPTCQERRAALQAVEGGRNQATFPRLEISEDGIITLEAGTARLVPAGSVARLEAALGEERRRRIIPADDLSFGDPSATAEPLPAAGQRFQKDMETAGWQEVIVVPAGSPDNPGFTGVGYDSADHDWQILADAGGDGRIEGYRVTRADGEASERVKATIVPTPNEAVGEWERQVLGEGG